MKKHISILFLFVAYSIILGHDIIPHHHHIHSHDHDVTKHHNNEGDEDTSQLNHLFSFLTHTADGVIFTNSHNISNTFSKQELSVATLLEDTFSFDEFFIPSLQHRPPAKFYQCISQYFFSSGLRAPPTTFI